LMNDADGKTTHTYTPSLLRKLRRITWNFLPLKRAHFSQAHLLAGNKYQ